VYPGSGSTISLDTRSCKLRRNNWIPGITGFFVSSLMAVGNIAPSQSEIRAAIHRDLGRLVENVTRGRKRSEKRFDGGNLRIRPYPAGAASVVAIRQSIPSSWRDTQTRSRISSAVFGGFATRLADQSTADRARRRRSFASAISSEMTVRRKQNIAGYRDEQGRFRPTRKSRAS
jgi:hypothetical protein